MGYAFTGLSPFDRIESEDRQAAAAMNDQSVQIVTASEIDQLKRVDGARIAFAPAA